MFFVTVCIIVTHNNEVNFFVIYFPFNTKSGVIYLKNRISIKLNTIKNLALLCKRKIYVLPMWCKCNIKDIVLLQLLMNFLSS